MAPSFLSLFLNDAFHTFCSRSPFFQKFKRKHSELRAPPRRNCMDWAQALENSPNSPSSRAVLDMADTEVRIRYPGRFTPGMWQRTARWFR